MKTEDKYVFFYCDECHLLEAVITIFRQLHPDIDVHIFSNVDELISRTNENVPEFILVYLSKPNHDFITAVKYIRENVNSALVPVMIYRHLPDEKELKHLFKKIL